MNIVDKNISLDTLKDMSEKMHNHFVKAVVDIKKHIMVVDADLHADEEEFLIDQGSSQEDLWGINLYPEHFRKPEFIEFDSMINIRPSWGNKSRYVESELTRKEIIKIVTKLVKS